MNLIFSFLFINTPLAFFAQSIWRDEAFSSLLAQKNIGEILILTARDSNPPLFYLLLHYWIKLFGNSEVALRSLSFIFFSLTVYVFYLFLHQILHHSTRRSAIYLLLIIVNPVLHYYAFEVRMYSMFAFFALTSYYFLIKKNYKWYSVHVALGLLTHYFMFFVVMSQFLFVLITKRKTNNIQNYLHSIFISCLFFFPWVIFILIVKPDINNTFWITKPDVLTFIQLPGIILTGFESNFWFKYPLLTPVSIFLLLTICVLLFHILSLKKYIHTYKAKALLYLLLIWTFFTPFVIVCFSFFKPIFLPRYFIFSTIGLLLLFSFTIPKINKFVEIAVLTTLLAISIQYAQIQIHNRKKANIREVAKVIKALINPEDVVYVTHEFNFHPMQYYINDKQVFIYGKTYDKLPWYIGKVLISPDNIAQSLPLYPKRAFILNDDLSFSIQAIY